MAMPGLMSQAIPCLAIRLRTSAFASSANDQRSRARSFPSSRSRVN